MVCCHTGEHKAAKARLSGQHPTANRRYLIPGVTWNGVALLIVGSLYVCCARADSYTNSVSTAYAALWERGRLDLTVEAMVLQSHRYHPLFTSDELKICEKRLREYGDEC